MKAIIFALFLALPFSTFADLETDKNAGVCAAYLTVIGRTPGAAPALVMADDQNRAVQFAKSWMNDFKRNMQGNETAMRGSFNQADSTCRKIGIRPADYK